jgi:hypothetical protein
MTSEIEPDYDMLPTGNSTPLVPYTRAEVLTILSGFIATLKARAEGGRIRDPAGVKCRIDAIKAGVSACSVLLSGMRDMQLDDVEQRLQRLEEAPV